MYLLPAYLPVYMQLRIKCWMVSVGLCRAMTDIGRNAMGTVNESFLPALAKLIKALLHVCPIRQDGLLGFSISPSF